MSKKDARKIEAILDQVTTLDGRETELLAEELVRRGGEHEMSEKYTAADFANARFAEHGTENDPAVRRPDIKGEPWKCACGGTWSDEDMAEMDWVPVPTKPVLTESEVKKMVGNYEVDDFAAGFAGGFRYAGGEIIPGPEPTNKDRLSQLIDDEFELSGLLAIRIAGHLDKH